MRQLGGWLDSCSGVPAAILLLVALSACTGSDYGPEVEAALLSAGPNRPQLESAIEHFKKAEDPREMEAVLFLIANMRFHYYEEVALFNTSRQEVQLDLFHFPTLSELRLALAEFERQSGPTHWGLKDRREDTRSISAELLVQNVEAAFRAWRTLPWARDLTWARFRELVLPYRVGNEALEAWREVFLSHYRNLPQQVSDPADPRQIAASINQDLGSWFRFDERFYFRRTDMSTSEMWRTGMGRCEDMANLAALAMRANGIPVSVDYTPFWPNSHGNHFWNTVHGPDRDFALKWGERGVLEESFAEMGFKMAKVYRKTFAAQEETLPYLVKGRATAPAFLSNRHHQDVTDRYFPVSEVGITLQPPPGDDQIAYLSVFNTGSWNPIAWTMIDGSRAVFKKMGMGIAYLPSYFEEGRAVPAAAPFILNEDGNVETLDGSGPRLDQVTVRWVKPHITHGDGLLQPPGSIVGGRRYLLYRWDNGWVRETREVAAAAELRFQGLREKTLYWLVEEGRGDEERPFTIEHGQPRYW